MTSKKFDQSAENRPGPKPREPKTAIGRRLVWLLALKKIFTYSEFEQKCHLPKGSMSRYMRGVRPNEMAILKIANATGCNPDWLADGEGDPFPGIAYRSTYAYRSSENSNKPALIHSDAANCAKNGQNQEMQIEIRSTRKPRDGDVCLCKIRVKHGKLTARILAYLVDE